MRIRRYAPDDGPELAGLFFQTVHMVNCKDYSEEQVNAWAPEHVDLKAWNHSFSGHYAVLAEIEGDAGIVGFGDIDQSGYLDRLYVHPDYQNRGVASKICDELEQTVSSGRIITHASITAKGFFEKRGYRVIREQQVERRGILLKNYLMERRISKGQENGV